MVASIGDKVHPWYKGNHEWLVKKIAKLFKPVEYSDKDQGEVKYDPKIIQLENTTGCTVLWFPYWMSTSNTGGKMKWGQRPPMLEEALFLELMKDAIKEGLFSKDFLTALAKELEKMPEV
jgi:hypothetical protein